MVSLQTKRIAAAVIGLAFTVSIALGISGTSVRPTATPTPTVVTNSTKTGAGLHQEKTLTQQLSIHPVVVSRSAAPGTYEQIIERCHPYSCDLWHSRVHVQYTIDGVHRPTVDWVDCGDAAGTTVAVNVTWCGNVWDARLGAMSVGDNITLDWAFRGSPVRGTCWQRLDIFPDGSTQTRGCNTGNIDI